MSFRGYLIKVGDYTIDKKYIKADTYKVKKNTLDFSATRMADGVLRREVIGHKPMKVEFNTPSNLTNSDISTLMLNIQRNYINADEKKVNVTLYDAETDSYLQQDMYIPDIEFTIKTIKSTSVQYDSIRFAFIGY